MFDEVCKVGEVYRDHIAYQHTRRLGTYNLHSWIGNGICSGGEYNTEECEWDGGDCVVPGYPNCHVDDPSYIGDGYCDNYGDFNTAECEWDGGDCPPP